MDFDPLSLYSPLESRNGFQKTDDFEEPEGGKLEFLEDAGDLVPRVSDNEEDFFQPLHALDLPMLRLKPPVDVLLVVLKLLKQEDQLNFFERKDIQEDQTLDGIHVLFDLKGITQVQLGNALKWLELYCERLNSSKKLSYVPSLSTALKKGAGYNSWLTSIVSSELVWITDDLDKATVLKEASLRLAENCGRTAQPTIIRKIILPNLLHCYSKSTFLRLKEPSLTNDNLGLKTWGSSLVLAKRLLKGADNKKNYLAAPVLELGSGTGLVGMVSLLLNYKTFLTDLPEILPNLRENLDLNEISAEVHELDWRDPTSFIKRHGDLKFKTIILSDPLYSSEHPFWIRNMVEKFLDEDPNAKVLMQLPLRGQYEKERELLWHLMEFKHVQIEEAIEKGYDDFGETDFCFKVYTRK